MNLSFDWQTFVVAAIVIGAIIYAIKALCLGNKPKCHDCANKCSEFKPDPKTIWIKKDF